VNDRAERTRKLEDRLLRPLPVQFARAAISLPASVTLVLSGLVQFMRKLMEARGAPARATRPDLEKRFGDGTRDEVEEASWESFPASDAPAR
jgi:hypothetical protein